MLSNKNRSVVATWLRNELAKHKTSLSAQVLADVKSVPWRSQLGTRIAITMKNIGYLPLDFIVY
jgi:hypothetical protein